MDGRFKLDNQLCFRLYTASRLITQAYHPLLAQHGLTYPQYLVLMTLWADWVHRAIGTAQHSPWTRNVRRV